jgi:cholesterol oxidase
VFDFDYIVIGSGFGGSVSALRLSEKGYSVAVLEMGKRWEAKDFPKTNMNVRKFIWCPSLFMYGIQQFTLLKHMYIAHGCGVGGGSLVYANTLPVPPSEVFRDPRWPSDEDWEAKLTPYYDLAKAMLGAVPAKEINETDELLRDVVDEDLNGGESTFRRHTVSVFYSEKPGEGASDPYFAGEGPDRAGCIHCGECMSGCKHNAKNTLDKNYLYLAENRGAQIIPETKVIDIKPVEGGGYEITTEKSTAFVDKKRRTFRCRGIVVSASVLGTVKLLLECKRRGSLPRLSEEIGSYVRTNGEAFGAVMAKDTATDFSRGIAITSGVNAPDGTHIEAVRWGRGHDFIGLNSTVFSGGGPAWSRWLRWLGAAIRHPIHFLIVHQPRNWAHRSFVIMGMRPSKSHLRLGLARRFFRRGLKSELVAGETADTQMDVVREVTLRLAKKIHGIPQSVILDALFNRVSTAHILGGATMGRSENEGVCDSEGRVFGYENMYICDGSLVPANLTVNPSLTITALSEYVMANVPAKEGSETKPVALSAPVLG